MAEGGSATYTDIIEKFCNLNQIYHQIYHQMIGLDELIFCIVNSISSKM